jgi:hypothetical protein
MLALIQAYDKVRPLQDLKNVIFGMVVLLLNTNKVSDEAVEQGSARFGQVLPVCKGMNPFNAAVTYYRPHGVSRGTEEQVDSYVVNQICQSEDARESFLVKLFECLVSSLPTSE